MADLDTIERVRQIDVDKYKYGFETSIESEKAPKGLSEEVIGFISAKKSEPQWMLDWRLEAFKRWQTMEEPTWALVRYPPIDYQAARYYANALEREPRNATAQAGLISIIGQADPGQRKRW